MRKTDPPRVLSSSNDFTSGLSHSFFGDAEKFVVVEFTLLVFGNANLLKILLESKHM